MRILGGLLVCLSIVCAEGIARADDEAEPKTLEEYRARSAQLQAAIRAAQVNEDDAATDALRRKFAILHAWGAQHLHRKDAALYTGGVLLFGLGSAAFVAGVIALSVGDVSNCSGGIFASCSGDTTMMITGGLMMGAGAVLALVSIPIISAGNKKTLDPSPQASIVFGPARIGLSVTF